MNEKEGKMSERKRKKKKGKQNKKKKCKGKSTFVFLTFVSMTNNIIKPNRH